MILGAYDRIVGELQRSPRRWLVTGVAGFIGSNLLETLLRLDQYVVGIDNFSTGKKGNLEDVRQLVSLAQWSRFQFVEFDIAKNSSELTGLLTGVDYVLHQAALGSVPRSLADPVSTHHANVTGFLNVLNAARESSVQRFVYASSSSVYGDHQSLPKVENTTGRVISPYAATKAINELYAEVFCHVYKLSAVGLRYFNVFGPRQDPLGQYAAVIPRWILAMLHNEPVNINGDGSISRDFCYIENTVRANILAATATLPSAHEVYNVALNARTTLNELFELIRSGLATNVPRLKEFHATYRDNRRGDIMHSQASIEKAVRELGYTPTVPVAEGIEATLRWYQARYT
jgi:UDP-N-acetylglucosamine 4-epimerase